MTIVSNSPGGTDNISEQLCRGQRADVDIPTRGEISHASSMRQAGLGGDGEIEQSLSRRWFGLPGGCILPLSGMYTQSA